MIVYVFSLNSRMRDLPDLVNALPPSDAVREQKKDILEDLFGLLLLQFKKYHRSGNLKFNNLGIFPCLKLRHIMGKILWISIKLNFTPNTLSWVKCRVTLSDLLRKLEPRKLHWFSWVEHKTWKSPYAMPIRAKICPRHLVRSLRLA